MKLLIALYLVTIGFLTIFSFGFIDPHLSQSLPLVASYHRPLATIIFLSLLLSMYGCYLYFLKNRPKIWVLIVSVVIFIFSYPALTYDLFNYITTAKVLYTYHENPYVVMPIEIPNEQYLAFTRAANKVALYGPVWLLVTAVPHALGFGNIWATILAFKLVNAAAFLLFCLLIYKWTKNLTNVIFFAFNPLVLIEVLMNGHNDIYMMILALVALRYKNVLALVASWFIKGATIVVTPLLFLKIPWDKMLVYAYWLLSFVFFVVGPLREELYPWYAIWLIAPAALLSYKSHKFLWQFTIVLSFALELRNLPYMWMGYYEGPGPLLRMVLTVIPIAIYLSWFSWRKIKR